MNSKLLREGLNQIKERFGLDVLREERKTIMLFSDFVPHGRVERNALKHGEKIFTIKQYKDCDFVIAQDNSKSEIFADDGWN